jgi:trehalose/maltose hydrolase-like predicted phosphorylase
MIRVTRSKVLALSALFAASAIAAVPESRSTFRFSATQADFGQYFPTYLANGYFSTMSSLRGTEANPAYLVGFMDYGPGDISRPALIPGWSEMDYFDGDQWLNSVPLRQQAFGNYQQTLDMYDGTLSTSYRWVNGSRSTRIRIVTFVSQDSPHLAASQIALTPEFDGVVRLTFPLKAWPAIEHRYAMATLTDAEVHSTLAANGQALRAVNPATADRAAIWYPGETHVESVNGSAAEHTLWLHGRALSGTDMFAAAAIALPADVKPTDVTIEKTKIGIALHATLSVHKGTTYAFAKFVAVSRSGWGGKEPETVAEASAARASGFGTILSRHATAWHTLWQADIQVTGDETLQRALHSDLFYLLQNTTVDTSWPVMACAFSPGYAGHTFWDSDSWVFPALLLLHPERAKPLVMFRFRTLDAATRRAQQHGLKGAMYPWESDPEAGTDQTPYLAWQVSEREIHVNADIAIAQWQYFLATNDLDWLRDYGWPVIRSVAEYWTSRVTRGASGEGFEILHVVSPDEDYSDVPNDTFTNAAARKALGIASIAAQRLGATPDPRWQVIADHLVLPFSTAEQRHLDFDASVPHDRKTWMGSSLAWLAYPSLDMPMTMAVRRNDFAYALHALDSQAYDPNSMLTVMLAVEAAEIGDTTAAYSWVKRNLVGFLKPPFNVRSETALNNVGYLLSPSGGFVQSFLFGFTGLRIDDQGLSAAYPPTLPSAWHSITLTNATFRGRKFDISVEPDTTGAPRLQRRQLSP